VFVADLESPDRRRDEILSMPLAPAQNVFTPLDGFIFLHKVTKMQQFEMATCVAIDRIHARKMSDSGKSQIGLRAIGASSGHRVIPELLSFNDAYFAAVVRIAP
jgi:hypothetical protein